MDGCHSRNGVADRGPKVSSRSAPSLAAQTLAVALTEQNRVLLFDARTYDSVASVPVGRAPHEIAGSPDGEHFYVAPRGNRGLGLH